MPTPLTKSVARVVETKHGALVVTMTQAGLCIREKGRRYEVGPLSFDTLYVFGADRENQQRRQKRITRGAL